MSAAKPINKHGSDGTTAMRKRSPSPDEINKLHADYWTPERKGEAALYAVLEAQRIVKKTRDGNKTKAAAKKRREQGQIAVNKARLEALKLPPALSRERKAQLIAPKIGYSEHHALKLLRKAEKPSRK